MIPYFNLCFGQMTVSIDLMDSIIDPRFILLDAAHFKFKLPTFSLPQCHSRIVRVVETERYFFLGKRIITLSPAAHIKLSATVHAKSHQFTLSHSYFLLLPFTAHYTIPIPHSMASETDWSINVTGDAIAAGTKTASGAESETSAACSSSKEAITKMENKTTTTFPDYWKKLTITKDDRSAYHTTGWLESIVPTVEYPTTDGSTVVCFESHLVTGLGIPPSKFFVAIMNFLECELVHLNPNAIAALSCFTMLCECWLGITPDTSLFWYFYSPA
jgi:hypothetical protein